MAMAHTQTSRHASRSDITAVLLAAIGLVSAPFIWFVAAVFTIPAGIILGVTVWVLHRPLTRWTRAGIWLVGLGLLLELVVSLFLVPVSVTLTTSG